VTGYTAAQGAIAALYGRDHGSGGTVLEIPMFDTAVTMISMALTSFFQLGKQPPRGGGQPYNAPAGDLVSTKDGHIILSAYTEQHFRRLCTAIGREDLARDPRFVHNDVRVANRPVLLSVLGEVFAEMTSDDVCALLEPAGIVSGAVRDFEGLARSEEFRLGNFMVDVENVDGESLIGLRSPMMPRNERAHGRIPRVGEHSRELLREIGWESSRVEAAISTGAIGAS
jgi:crotonobetainyl-CoA:carnitine CoA-transferase CaiB-like acyl-CoA transferase